MIIKYCLFLLSKFSVPHKISLRPKSSFRIEILESVSRITDMYFDVEQYIVLLFDEMKIKIDSSNIPKNSGFFDLGDPELNFYTFQNNSNIHFYILYFM